MDEANVRQLSSTDSDQVAQNPLGISYEEILKVLQVKCKKHPKRNAEYLHLKPDVENARICNLCVKEDDIPRENCQDIREIFSESAETDMLYYPVLTESELREIIQNIDENMESEKILMDKYFEDLMSKVEVIIEGRNQARKLKLVQYEGLFQSSKVCWSEIIEIQNLKKVLLEENNEVKLAQFVRNHISNSERNTQRIKEVSDQLNGIKDYFSMQQPNKIKSLVSSFLEEIDFFQGTHPSPLYAIQQTDEYRNALLRQQNELKDCQSQINQFQQNMQSQQRIFEEMRIEKERKSEEIMKLKQENMDLKKNISAKDSQIFNMKQEIQTIKEINEDKSPLKQQLKEEKVIIIARLKEQLDIGKKNTQLLNEDQLPFKRTDLLPGTNLILGDYVDSDYLCVNNYLQELQFLNNDDTRDYYLGISYLDFILNPSTNYIIHVQLEQAKGQDKYFYFGLLPDAVKDEPTAFDECIGYSEYEEIEGDLNTYLKGNAIRSDPDSLERKSLEMRINIERQILRVGTPPNYESVVQIDDPKQIESTTPYRFYLFGLNKLTKMTITKLETVNQFNNLM